MAFALPTPDVPAVRIIMNLICVTAQIVTFILLQSLVVAW